MENCLTQPAYYGKSSIYDYLQRAGYKLAASCWANEKGITGIVDTEETAKWFENKLVGGGAEYIRMETEVIAYWGNLKS